MNLFRLAWQCVTFNYDWQPRISGCQSGKASLYHPGGRQCTVPPNIKET